MQMRIEKWETAVDIKGALDKLPKMATGGMILAVINDVLKNVQYAPTTGALTITLEEARAIREGFLGETGCLAMQRVVNAVLSRRTAEPQPAAEPSPAPVDKPSPADAQGDLATPIGDSSFADKICEILYRRVGMGRLDNDPIAKEIIAVAQDHPPAGWVSVEKERHEFENFHNNLCKRFGYHHDPIDWNRDLASLEEHIASLIPKKTLQDRVEEIILQAGLTKTAKTLAAEIVAELKGAGE